MYSDISAWSLLLRNQFENINTTQPHSRKKTNLMQCFSGCRHFRKSPVRLNNEVWAQDAVVWYIIYNYVQHTIDKAYLLHVQIWPNAYAHIYIITYSYIWVYVHSRVRISCAHGRMHTCTFLWPCMYAMQAYGFVHKHKVIYTHEYLPKVRRLNVHTSYNTV